MRRFLPLPVLALLAACGTTEAPVRYSPTVPVQAAAVRPVVTVSGRVVNERRDGREDPTWVGTIRSGHGSPMKVLKADQPVDRVVARASEDGLAARGLLVPGGGASPYLLAVTIHQLDANQYARREATAGFGAVLTERASGRAVWRGRRKAYKVDGSLVTLNAFASVDDFRRTGVSAIGEAVDALLDDPGFRAALRRG